jgi:hypothetical protein
VLLDERSTHSQGSGRLWKAEERMKTINAGGLELAHLELGLFASPTGRAAAHTGYRRNDVMPLTRQITFRA